MKKSRDLESHRIDSRKIRSLMSITGKTRNGQVAGHGLAAVDGWGDVIDFKRQSVTRLRHLAVLTDRIRTLAHEFGEFSIHKRLRKRVGGASAPAVLATEERKAWRPLGNSCRVPILQPVSATPSDS
jgi:hypothetical protein